MLSKEVAWALATTTCVLGATNAQEKKVLMGKYITGSGNGKEYLLLV